MKKLFVTTSALVLMNVVPVLAEEFNHSIDLNATVNDICTFSNEVTLDGDRLSEVDAAILFSADINQDTSIANQTSDIVRFGNSFCNTASTVTLTRTNFDTETPAVGDFVNEIMYSAKAKWGNEQIAILEIGGANEDIANLSAPKSGQIEIIIEIFPDSPLVAGDYEGTLTLEITSS